MLCSRGLFTSFNSAAVIRTPYILASGRSLATKEAVKPRKLNPGTALLTGGFSGALGALCGVGGGVIQIPVLKHFTSIPIKHITATSLFAISLSSFFGAVSYIDSGFADVPAALAMSCTSVLTSGIGARLAGKTLSPKVLSTMLAVAMLGAVPIVLSATSNTKPKSNFSFETFGNGLKKLGNQYSNKIKNSSFVDLSKEAMAYLRENPYYPLFGALSGFLSGMLGVGGGIVLTTMLASMPSYIAQEKCMTQHQVVATSLVVMVPTALSGTMINIAQKSVHFKSGILLAASSSAAMFLTSSIIAPNLKEQDLRYIFAAILSLSSLRMLL